MSDYINENTTSSPTASIKDLYNGEDSNISFAQSDSCPNAADVLEKKVRKSDSGKSRYINSRVVTPDIIISDLHEYRWPPDEAEGNVPFRGNEKESSDWFVLQEVVSSLLQIKSFKRRYPDLYRRPVDGWEKDWLVKQGWLPRGVGDLGLTALRAEEVLSLLERDFPEIHEQAVGMLQDRKIQLFTDQQKEHYQDIIHQTSRIERGSSTKLDMIRRKAVKSAAEYNRALCQDRRRERLFYWDLQTMQIHVSHQPPPTKRPRAQSEPQHTEPLFPVALLAGQFGSKFRAYNEYELGYLPLNTAVFTLPDLDVLKAKVAADNATASAASQVTPTTAGTSTTGAGLSAVPTDTSVSTEATATAGNSSTSGTPPLCSVCRQKCSSEECSTIKCHECGKSGHPQCMDLKDDMIPHVLKYTWCCIDCKKCLNCQRATDEEQMMFCDRCDRGYHAYCVGLTRIPEGSWECSYCQPGPSVH